MKKGIFIIVVILAIVGVIGVLWFQLATTLDKWKVAEANVKAYATQLANSEDKSIALQLTIDQLEYFNDSVFQDLNKTREELKIKDKNLKALQKISSSFSRIDTITLKDTLFKEPSFAMDTTLGDKWYSLSVGLKYPSVITVKPEFKSEKNIVVSLKKETVNPPKKFFLFRWFQKKHKILKVDVIEKNPYVKSEDSRYIEILK